MREFSTFFGLLLAPDADVSVVPACMVVLPGPFLCQPGYPKYHFVSSLLKTFAVALVLEAHSWQKHVAFLLNYMRVLSVGPSKPSTWVFCGAGFWPWFSPWPFAQTYLPFSDSCLMVNSFVFSPALHRCPLRSLVQRLVFTTYVSSK